ncbi:MAG: hypothetical protein PHW73_01865 [Atribacterota bacterium]|nr:hypothetical protein [Atribacterota bacterium]
MSIRNHNWENLGTLQWASRGLPWESAHSTWRCKDCGIEFLHYYHTEPNIYKAFGESGLPKECSKKKQ